MKKYLVVVYVFVLCNYAHGQVTCIFCYQQNAPINTSVTNLLLNGGFENNNCIPNDWFSSSYCPNSSYYSCNISNWICTGGGIQTYADIIDINYAQVVEGTYAVYFGNFYCNACSVISNDTSCFVNDGCTVSGIPVGYPTNTAGYGGNTGISLRQTVTGLVPGHTYVLEFWAGGEDNQSLPGVFAVDLGFGDTLLRCKPVLSLSGIGTRYVIEFIAASASHIIKFTNWGHICTDCTELILDDVRLFELSPSTPPCNPTDINELNENASVTIYPNPITDKLNITLTNNESSQIILYDIAARKLLQQSFTNSVSLNTTQLERGIYFYEVRSGNKIIRNGKVVKE